MKLDDRALPAARHLVGPDAVEVLRVPIEAVGGRLVSARPVQVQYRPGSDVVVRYSAQVSWRDAPVQRETLVASSTLHGAHAGTVQVTAMSPGGPLEVGVWRWPFDPVLVGLEHVVTPQSVVALLEPIHGPLDPREVGLEVVAYRPTDRAVMRVDVDGATLAYLKVVKPDAVGAIAERHRSLASAGVPVPSVRAADESSGVIVLAPLIGPTLRELIKTDTQGWPDCREFDRLADAFADAPIVAPPVDSRLTDAALHARMLAVVMADSASRLTDLAERFESTPAPRADAVIHGDLHEAQIIVENASIVGVLDIDDAGPGLAIDDRANLLARLTFRATTDPARGADIGSYVDRLRSSSFDRFDPGALDRHTAAALVGLATGPFRLQSPGWSDTVGAVLDVAEELMMRELSATAHRRLTGGCAQ